MLLLLYTCTVFLSLLYIKKPVHTTVGIHCGDVCLFFRQKVNLWQHADELEQEQVSKGVWIDSRMVAACMGCKTAFTIFNRKVCCLFSICYKCKLHIYIINIYYNILYI